jgi:hypothetical protein
VLAREQVINLYSCAVPGPPFHILFFGTARLLSRVTATSLLFTAPLADTLTKMEQRDIFEAIRELLPPEEALLYGGIDLAAVAEAGCVEPRRGAGAMTLPPAVPVEAPARARWTRQVENVLRSMMPGAGYALWIS